MQKEGFVNQGRFSPVVVAVMNASGGRSSWQRWQCRSSLPAAISELSEPPRDLTSARIAEERFLR